jgi:hypothetical protein
VSYFTLRLLSKKCTVAKHPMELSDYLGPGQSVLSFSVSRSSFLIGELHLGKLGESVVVHGNAPHDRPCFFVSHLIGNRASFLCTKAPMLRVPETNFLQGITSISGRPLCGLFPGLTAKPKATNRAGHHSRHQRGFYKIPSSITLF